MSEQNSTKSNSSPNPIEGVSQYSQEITNVTPHIVDTIAELQLENAPINFTKASEHILSSPSDLAEVVRSFENLQPIYGSEALNFQSAKTIDNPPEEEDQGKKDKKKSDVKSDKKSDKDEQEDKEWIGKRERRKSSVLTDADIRRISSKDPYAIDIPLKKKINRNTRKKLWREIQKRRFITESVYAHIQHYAKPPFKTWGCYNCNYRKDVRPFENWKE